MGVSGWCVICASGIRDMVGIENKPPCHNKHVSVNCLTHTPSRAAYGKRANGAVKKHLWILSAHSLDPHSSILHTITPIFVDGHGILSYDALTRLAAVSYYTL